MKRIILFRFHVDVDICKNRLGLLKGYNPEVKIFGLFGGQEKDLEKFQKALNPYLESIYCIRGKSPYWKRTHGDLAMKLWYENIGKTLVFDTLYYIEWDLLLFESLEKIYGHIPENGVGLTSLTLLKNIEKEWFWLSDGSLRKQWHCLLGFVKDKYGYDQEPFACEFSGACIPRGFLEKYSSAEIPELCHDELRVPLFSQVFNYKFYNTNFCKKWFDGSEKKFFNCDNKEISLSTITKELVKPSGRRVFHPVIKMFVFDKPIMLRLRRKAAGVLKRFIKQPVAVLRFARAMVMARDQEELIIIVPYRDRGSNLKQFIPHMHAFLKNIKHRIVVIEQAGDGLFNKAKLLNVGFSLYQGSNAFFCFHDVDLLPKSASCDYSYPVMPTHLSAYCSQFEYQFMPYCFGGVILVNKEDFRRVNGFSNQYWGWGGEDDDLRKRFDMTWDVPWGRRMGRYHSIERVAFHYPEAHADVKRSGNPQYQKNCIRLGIVGGLSYDPKTDGLSDLKYELLETIVEEGYVKHIVRF